MHVSGLKRILVLVYWTATLQLSWRRRERHKAKEIRRRRLNQSYQDWIDQFDNPSEMDEMRIGLHIESFKQRPFFSIIVIAGDTSETAIQETTVSIQEQLYNNWELCVISCGSVEFTGSRKTESSHNRNEQIERVYANNCLDSNILNSAIEAGTGEYVILLNHGHLLSPHALYEITAAINENNDLDFIYTDEDRLDSQNRRHSPHFKTDWNERLMLSHDYIGQLAVFRRTVLDDIGGVRSGFGQRFLYDLILRTVIASGAKRIHHIPAVLCHKRDAEANATPDAAKAARAAEIRLAAADYIRIRDEQAVVEPHPTLVNSNRVRLPLPSPPPLVSLIVPTRDRADLLRTCIDGLLTRTAYPSIEVLIVDNESRDPKALALLASLGADSRVRILPQIGPFNYSAMNNRAAREAKGDIIGLINNDIDVIGPDWLSEMVSLAVVPNVGAVGARLLYGDGRVQHAGIVLGGDSIAFHLHHYRSANDPGYFGRAMLTSEVSAVTAACMLMRRTVFEAVGGLDEINLPVAYNDVDLCLRIGELGLSIVWSPFAELYHLESATRGSDLTPENIDRLRSEIKYMKERWGTKLFNDPFYNPNLALSDGDFKLAIPPRRIKPWASFCAE